MFYKSNVPGFPPNFLLSETGSKICIQPQHYYKNLQIFKKIEGGPELVPGRELVHHHYVTAQVLLMTSEC